VFAAQSRFLCWITAKARNGTQDSKPRDQIGIEVHQIWRSTRPTRLAGTWGIGGADPPGNGSG